MKKGDQAAVDRMLDADPSLVSARDERGTSAVLLAHYYGKSEVAAALLSRAPALDVFEAATAGDALQKGRHQPPRCSQASALR